MGPTEHKYWSIKVQTSVCRWPTTAYICSQLIILNGINLTNFKSRMTLVRHRYSETKALTLTLSIAPTTYNRSKKRCTGKMAPPDENFVNAHSQHRQIFSSGPRTSNFWTVVVQRYKGRISLSGEKRCGKNYWFFLEEYLSLASRKTFSTLVTWDPSKTPLHCLPFSVGCNSNTFFAYEWNSKI